MFVIEDPSQNNTERQKNLRKAQIRSHAAVIVHHRRSHRYNWSRQNAAPTRNRDNARIIRLTKQLLDDSPEEQIATSPPTPPLSINGGELTLSEARAARFYQERTAPEWSSWTDATFWTELVPQAGYQVSALRHAMVSLGAYHEFVEEQQSAAGFHSQAIACNNASQALRQLAKEHSRMSLSTILLSHIVIVLMSLILDLDAHVKAEHMLFDLWENIKQLRTQKSPLLTKEDNYIITNVLEPIVWRQLSKSGVTIDAIYCLENTSASFFRTDGVTGVLSIPMSFESISQAHHVLESLLEHAVYVVKTESHGTGDLPEESELSLQLWAYKLHSFTLLKPLSRTDRSSITLLKICAKLGAMMIKTMNAHDETIFDSYTDLFEDLAEGFEESVQCRQQMSKSSMNFSLSPGLLTLAGNCAARWCRDPRVRTRLIEVLLTSQKCDGNQSSVLWAHIAGYVRHFEEGDIYPPPKSCKDIPATNRAIMNSVSFFATSMQIKLELLRDPWGSCTTHEFWIPWVGMDDHPRQLNPTPRRKLDDETPVGIMGRGYTSRFNTSTGRWYSHKGSRFFFPLPKN